jgi:hypothetical protein
MTEPTDKPLLDEQQLDEYLKGDSSVSRQYRQLPGADVPASLDRLVLRQAEDAVKRPSRPAWIRWTAPLAVAASAVLVVSIVVQTGLRDETTVAAPPTMAQKRAAESALENKVMQQSAEAAPRQAEATPAEAALPAPPPPKVEVPPAPVVADEPRAFARRPAPPPPAAPAGDLDEIAVQGGGAVARTEEEMAERAVAKADDEDKAELATADLSRAKSARQDLARREQQDAVAQRATRTEQAQAAGASNAAPAAVLSYSRPITSSAADNVATIQRTYTDPEEWLKDIRQLRKDNKQQDADKEWHRFREAFPDYQVAETDPAREAKK